MQEIKRKNQKIVIIFVSCLIVIFIITGSIIWIGSQNRNNLLSSTDSSNKNVSVYS